MTNAELQVIFDIIVDNFNPNDDFSVEDTNHQMHKNWQRFLKAGFDATSITKMMSPEDIWEHYDELIANGAKIDMTKLFSDFSGKFFDKNFTKENWDKLVNRGISPDLLADRCYCDYYCNLFNTDNLEELLAKGISAEKALELISDWLENHEAWPEEQIEILTWLYDHGLPRANVTEWLEKHANSKMVDYIVRSDSDFYKEFDMEDDHTFDCWLDANGYEYFNEKELSELPNKISVDMLINFFSMKNIINNCSLYGFGTFISNYLKVGESIDTLAKKFMDEIGYSSNPSDSDAMLDLVWAGASVDIIDPAKYLNLVDVSQLTDYIAESWYDYFECQNYDNQLISKLLKQ